MYVRMDVKKSNCKETNVQQQDHRHIVSYSSVSLPNDTEGIIRWCARAGPEGHNMSNAVAKTYNELNEDPFHTCMRHFFTKRTTAMHPHSYLLSLYLFKKHIQWTAAAAYDINCIDSSFLTHELHTN